jgi:protein MpaA
MVLILSAGLGGASAKHPKSCWKKECSFRSVKGRPIDVLSIGKGPRTMLVIGGVHGDEPQGVRLVRDLMAHIAEAGSAKIKNRIIVIPVANPDGLAAKTRWNAHKVDINRNLPTSDFKVRKQGRYFGGTKPLSEPETRAILAVLKRYHPSFVVSVHAPLGRVLYSGNAGAEAKLISSLDGLPIRGGVGYSTPGALGTFCGAKMKIPIVTLEILPTGDQWRRHGKALMTVLGVRERGKG